MDKPTEQSESTESPESAKPSVTKKSDFVTKSTELLKTSKEKFDRIEFQPILDKVKKGLKAAVDVLEKGTKKAAEKTSVMSKQAGLQYTMYLHHHQLQKTLAELGGRVYDLTKENRKIFTPPDSQAMDIIAKITELEKKISATEERSHSLGKQPPSVPPE